MLTQSFRVVVDHSVRRVSAPVANDLTAHTRIYEVRNPSSPERMHPHTKLHQIQLPQDWIKLVSKDVCQPQRSAVLGLKKISALSAVEVLS